MMVILFGEVVSRSSVKPCSKVSCTQSPVFITCAVFMPTCYNNSDVLNIYGVLPF